VPVTIGSNIASLRAQRQLGQNSTALADVFTRLSSGQRINKASDDAAGLSIASSLHADGRVYTQAIRNLNDGLSAINIIDGALEQGSAIIAREKELSEQSANGSYSNQQRTAMDTEAQALRNEYNRIMASTSFNGLKLLDGTLPNITLQAGYGSSEQLVVPVSNYATNTVVTTVAGTGTFQAGISILANWHKVTVGDFNADGIPDVAGDNSGGGGTCIGFGVGDGTFGIGSVSAKVGGAAGVTARDINGDGKIDLIGAGDVDGNPGPLSVSLGNGNGTFSSPVSYAITGNTFALADVNGDGKLDVMSASTNGNSFVVAFGNGDGSFKSPGAVTYVVGAGGNVTAIDTRDLNGDGRADVFVTDEVNNTLDVFFGNGNGSFAALVPYAAGFQAVNTALGDFDGDGKLDAAVSHYGDGNLSILLGNGNGSFRQQVVYATSGILFALTVADLNGDGKADITTSGSTASVEALLGNGNGTFRALVTVPGPSVSGLAVADVNRDGVPDVIATPGDVLTTYLANTAATTVSGTGNYTLPSFSLATQSSSLSAMDTLSTALTNLETARGQFGAWQSRIQIAISNLNSSTTQYQAAESRIVDDDIAADSAELTRRGILQQAGAAVLAQANQQPQIALTLLSSAGR
jgi:flagellin-like hook-associated protein FlgL